MSRKIGVYVEHEQIDGNPATDYVIIMHGLIRIHWHFDMNWKEPVISGAPKGFYLDSDYFHAYRSHINKLFRTKEPYSELDD